MACCKKRDFDTSHEVFFDKLQCINKKEKNNVKYVVLKFNALIRRIRRKEKKKKGFLHISLSMLLLFGVRLVC